MAVNNFSSNQFLYARRWRNGVILFVIWTLIGVLSVSQIYSFYLYSNQRMPFWRTMLRQVPAWYLWAIITPLIFRLGQRFHYERLSRLKWGAVHFSVGLLLALINVTVIACFRQLFPLNYNSATTFILNWISSFSGSFHLGFLFYGAILGVGYAVEFYRRYRERELAATRLEKQLTQAELNALKMQLHPHFLFNTLHSIAALVRKEENKTAVKMLTGLGDLLRYTLGQAAAQEVPLKQELEFVEQYLELEQVRFQDRLQIKFDVATETLEAQTPNLILQPLVENAVRHGIAKRAAASLIEISVWRADNKLWLQVRDDGPGLAAEGETTERAGVGLANTHARLRQLYRDDYSFVLQNAPENGAIVRLSIPFRALPAASSQS